MSKKRYDKMKQYRNAEILKEIPKKSYEVILVTGTSIVYEDKGLKSFIGKKGFEDVKKGDMITI